MTVTAHSPEAALNSTVHDVSFLMLVLAKPIMIDHPRSRVDYFDLARIFLLLRRSLRILFFPESSKASREIMSYGPL